MLDPSLLGSTPFNNRTALIDVISPRELAWAAGFLEGEGTFRFNAPRNPLVTASQVQREPLDRLQRLFGGQIYLVHNRQMKARGWRPCHRWVLCGSAAAGLGMTVHQMMSPWRRAQIVRMLDGWRRLRVAHKFKTRCPSGHAYEGANLYRSPSRPGRYCRECSKTKLRAWATVHATDRKCVICGTTFRHAKRKTCSRSCRYEVLSQFNLARWKTLTPAQRSERMKGVRSVVGS